jgi:glycine/D-amino acid oxidase-like deaminating enzyme
MPDVVVVGGGVVGASVAWHLARSGIRDVLVVDRAAAPGEGSTISSMVTSPQRALSAYRPGSAPKSLDSSARRTGSRQCACGMATCPVEPS